MMIKENARPYESKDSVYRKLFQHQLRKPNIFFHSLLTMKKRRLSTIGVVISIAALIQHQHRRPVNSSLEESHNAQTDQAVKNPIFS